MKTISRIAYSNDKKNKTRSILIMMSICLTTMLLVIISTVGNGMIRLQKSQATGSYGMVEIAKRNNVSERTIYRYKAYYDKLREKEE